MNEYATIDNRPDGAVVVSLRGAHSGNAYTYEECCQFIETIVDIINDGSASAVLFRSARKPFCAGATRSYLDRMIDDSLVLSETNRILEAQVQALTSTEIPIICAIRGACYGVGLILAVHSDIVVVEETASFASVHITALGVPAGVGVASVLPSVVGAKRARDFLLTGGPIGGRDAVSIGLATRLAEPHEAEVDGERLLELIAGMSRSAVAGTKRAMNRWSVDGNDAEEVSRSGEIAAFREQGEVVREHLNRLSAAGLLW